MGQVNGHLAHIWNAFQCPAVAYGPERGQIYPGTYCVLGSSLESRERQTNEVQPLPTGRSICSMAVGCVQLRDPRKGFIFRPFDDLLWLTQESFSQPLSISLSHSLIASLLFLSSCTFTLSHSGVCIWHEYNTKYSINERRNHCIFLHVSKWVNVAEFTGDKCICL